MCRTNSIFRTPLARWTRLFKLDLGYIELRENDFLMLSYNVVKLFVLVVKEYLIILVVKINTIQ